MESINDKIYISPFYEEPLSENPFNQKSRSYPVDLEYPKTKFFISQIQIPEGYEPEYVPENYELKASLVEIVYSTEMPNENILLIKGNYAFKQAVYDAEDYLKLKFYCNDIIKKFNDKIVLKKANLSESALVQ